MSRNALRTLKLTIKPRLASLAYATFAVAALFWAEAAADSTLPWSITDTNHARVIIVHDPAATDAFRPRLPKVRALVDKAICALATRPSVEEAWRSLVSTNDTVGIKVYSAPGANSGTRPAVVEAVVQGLLAAAIPARQIIVWDRQTVDLRLAGFFDLADRYGIRVAGSAQAGYDEKNSYDSPLLGNLVWGDSEFGLKGESLGRKSFVSKLVANDLTKIINISPMLNNNLTGVSGNLYSLAVGSIDNVARFESDADRLATTIPEVYALPSLSDKVILSITDALICQYEGNERALLHYSSVLNQLRFSFDPVALDVLSLQELDRQRRAAESPEARPRLELYQNAALLELGISDTTKIDVVNLP